MTTAPPAISSTSTFDIPIDNTSHYTPATVIDLTNIDHSEYNLVEYFDIANTVQYITEYNVKHSDRPITDIALQLPDTLLQYGSELVITLYKHLNNNNTNIEDNVSRKVSVSRHIYNIFILGDTSYGACCIDTVNTAHLSTTALIIHYGITCFSGISSTYNVLYVFGKGKLDISGVVERLQHNTAIQHSDKPVLLFIDQLYAHYITELTEQLQTLNLLYHNDKQQTNTTYIIPSVQQRPATLQPNQHYITGYLYTLPDHIKMNECQCIWIGKNDSPLYTNLLLNYNSTTFYTYCTVQHTITISTNNISRLLARRYYLIQKTKNCQSIGIVIASLSMSYYNDILQRIKTLLKQHNRKFYVISMGKITETKLGNFSNYIDIYVIVTCPLQCLIDTKNYYHDIVTPYELQLALDDTSQWTGQYDTDSTAILDNNSSNHGSTVNDDEYNVDGMRYDSLTQTMKAVTIDNTDTDGSKHHNDTSLTYNTDTQLSTTKNDNQLQHSVNVLKQGTFQGVQRRRGLDKPAQVQLGLSGIASTYDKEIEQ